MSIHHESLFVHPCPVKGPPDKPVCWQPLGHTGPHVFAKELQPASSPPLRVEQPRIEAVDEGLRAAIAYLNAWVKDAATGDQDVAARLAWYICRKRLEELAHARQ